MDNQFEENPTGRLYDEHATFEFAGKLLMCALQNGIEAAVDLMLEEDHTDISVSLMMMMWCDTYAHVVPDAAQACGPGFMDLEGTAFENVDDVDPEVVWAGRFLFARVKGDRDMYTALYKSQQSAEQAMDNMVALLNVVSSSVRFHAGLPPLIPE